MTNQAIHDPLQPHTHEPNPTPPTAVSDFLLTLPDGYSYTITVERLQQLPVTTIANCYIISTGHGTSGPFTFTGVTLLDLITTYSHSAWSEVEVISGDSFGNRVYAAEVYKPHPNGPILLAYSIDGQPLTRQQGLIRLIVPGETDDALRQVKWVGEINMKERSGQQYHHIFNDSYDRILQTDQNNQFFDTFYQNFLATSTEVTEKFKNTDFKRQKMMLKKSFMHVLDFYSTGKANTYMNQITHVHSQAAQDIRPELYDLWLNSLVAAVQTCDPYFDQKVELAWRMIFSSGITYMKSHYDKPLLNQ